MKASSAGVLTKLMSDLQPEGLLESSRGSKRSGDPLNTSPKDSHPGGVRRSSSLTPSGSQTHFQSDPGVSRLRRAQPPATIVQPFGLPKG